MSVAHHPSEAVIAQYAAGTLADMLAANCGGDNLEQLFLHLTGKGIRD